MSSTLIWIRNRDQSDRAVAHILEKDWKSKQPFISPETVIVQEMEIEDSNNPGADLKQLSLEVGAVVYAQYCRGFPNRITPDSGEIEIGLRGVKILGTAENENDFVEYSQTIVEESLKRKVINTPLVYMNSLEHHANEVRASWKPNQAIILVIPGKKEDELQGIILTATGPWFFYKEGDVDAYDVGLDTDMFEKPGIFFFHKTKTWSDGIHEDDSYDEGIWGELTALEESHLPLFQMSKEGLLEEMSEYIEELSTLNPIEYLQSINGILPSSMCENNTKGL